MNELDEETREVGGALDRRRRELYGTLAARREDAVEAEFEREIAAFERPLDGFLSQCLSLALKQDFGCQGR